MKTITRPEASRYAFVPALLRLALPIALQSLMMTALNLADTFMVGQLGEVEIGAIALGNQVFFVLMLFQFGVGSGAAVFAAQYWGDGDVAGVRRTLGISLLFAIGGALLFTAGATMVPEVLLSAFTEDSAVIAEGRSYLRIVGTSYIFTAVSIAFTHSLRSVGETRLPMYATGISITLNIVGNYALIFGRFGFPQLGVPGAAISTAFARLIEVLIIVGAVYRKRGPIAAPIRQLVDWNRRFVTNYLRRAAPVVVNELVWSIGFTMYTLVFGRMGTSYLAAYNIADTVRRLLMVIFIASGQATAVLIGNEIGAGRRAHAEQIGLTIIHRVPIVAAMVGLIGFFVVAPIVPGLFEISEASRIIVRQFLRLFSILLVIKTINLHVIVGILRGGADTTFGLVIDIAPLWLLGIPAAMVTGLVLGLPASIVYLALNIEEATRLLLGWRRVHSGRWIHDLTGHERDTLPGIEAAGAPPITEDPITRESSPDSPRDRSTD